jgi:hypothetical protein
MDIDGAKALEERLARSGAVKARPPAAAVPEGAPPIYRWFAFDSSVDGAAAAPTDEENRSTLGPDGLGLPSTS